MKNLTNNGSVVCLEGVVVDGAIQLPTASIRRIVATVEVEGVFRAHPTSTPSAVTRITPSSSLAHENDDELAAELLVE